MTFLFVPELAISGFLWFAARAVISARGAVTESSSRQERWRSFKVPPRPRFAFYLDDNRFTRVDNNYACVWAGLRMTSPLQTTA